MSTNAESRPQNGLPFTPVSYSQRVREKIQNSISKTLLGNPKPFFALDTCVLIDLFKTPTQYKLEYQAIIQTFQLGITATILLELNSYLHRTTAFYLQDNFAMLHQMGIQMLSHPMVARDDYNRVVTGSGLDQNIEREIYADICIGLEVTRSPAILFVTNNFTHFKVFQACGALPFGFKQLVKVLQQLKRI